MDNSRTATTPACVSAGPESTTTSARSARAAAGKLRAAAEPPRAAVEPLRADDPIACLSGIGPKTAERLAAHGLATVRDLLHWFPRRYAELAVVDAPSADHVGRLVRVSGVVAKKRRVFLPGRRAMVTIDFTARDGSPFAVMFFNQPWLLDAFAIGDERVLEGTLEQKGKRFVLKGARVHKHGEAAAGAVQLRYGDVEGIGASRLQQWLDEALRRVDWDSLHLPPLPRALAPRDAPVRDLFLAMHRAVDVDAHERAREHFAVREAVRLFADVAAARARRTGRHARGFPVDAAIAARIRARLPFALTGDQDRAVQELWRRLAGPAPMGVLLQGDVGTGKTAVAIAAALAVVARGAQVAFLLPTELLAAQHCRTASAWLEGSDVRVQLLTASLDARTRRTLAAEMQHGAPRIWFGTHALLSDDADFESLGLVVVDEQHRFGVEQRMQLVHKGNDPHVLVMTATPIPRTLALATFGDLDLVVLKDRPGARPLPRALHREAKDWPRVLRSIARAVRRRGRVYVVCPAVGEDGEKGGAVRVFESLRDAFRCRLVHGRMPASEQQEAVAAFRRGDCDVLVGTTVLEVGVDVPEATLMVVVRPDRFGLATLHQLRGRVGRGARRGLCVLCGNATERTAALCRTNDGFELAEIDLALRGSGELLGTQQSGFAGLRALDPITDRELLLEVRAAVGLGLP